jgi:cyclohexanone monooxygenase
MPEREPPAEVDALIVGAGFAGMYMLYRMRNLGFSAWVVESGSDVGGTWYFNRYPGARCDIESLAYQYSFADEIQREWNWSERYAAQPELLAYARFVADKFDLRSGIQFNTRVTSAHYRDDSGRWHIETDQGDVFSARFCIMATGCLSVPRVPDYPGLDSFEGDWYHTGEWPHEGVDFTGKRVGVVGTGSSGIQSIPLIAEQALSLTVFQRTPNFAIPAHNRALTQTERDKNKAAFQDLRREAEYFVPARSGGQSDIPKAFEVDAEAREARYEKVWQMGGLGFMTAFSDLLVNREANDTAVEFVHGKIRSMVKDPAVAALLSPRTYPLGTKRLCVDTGYYGTYNLEHVDLVDLRAQPILEVTPRGIRTSGAEYEFDSIVFATGFDAMTGALLRIDIRGREGVALRDEWLQGPRTYLGLQVAGFPNFFTITGPGSPSVLSNMLVSIEQHVAWISDCMEYLRERDLGVIEPTAAAQDAWVEHCRDLGERTLYPLANSWYMGANVEGKPRVLMPYVAGVGPYRKHCDKVAAEGYTGFVLSR